MRKPAFANAKHKGADQLRYWLTNAFVVSLTSNIVSLASESTTSSLYPSSVDVQPFCISLIGNSKDRFPHNAAPETKAVTRNYQK